MISAKYDKLTTDQKEAAVGVAAGWVLNEDGTWTSPEGVCKQLPLFTSSLDAVSHVEVSLTPKQYNSYFSVLETLCKPTAQGRAILATAELRCKALVLNSLAVKPVKPAKLIKKNRTLAPVKKKVTAKKILRKTDMITEHCEGCDTDVEIPAYGITGCPNCKQHIRPCSMCDLDTQPCNFDEETGACFVYRRGYKSA